MIKKLLKKSYLFIGFGIFIWVMKDINFSEFLRVAPQTNLFLFFLSFTLYLPMVMLISYRWKKIIGIQGIQYSYKEAFQIYASGLFIGLITPGRLGGDASKVIYLKKNDRPLGKAVFGVLLDKLSDLIFVCIFLGITFPFLSSFPRLPFNYPSFLKFFLASFLGLILLFAFFYLKRSNQLHSLFLILANEIKKFRPIDGLIIAFLTIANWSTYFIMVYLIAASVGIHSQIGFFYLAFSAALITLLAFLPISVLGIGTREAALIFFLTPLGLSKETVVIFSLLITFNYLSLLLICLHSWLKKPLF